MSPLESFAVSFAIELNGIRPEGNGIESACNEAAERPKANNSTTTTAPMPIKRATRKQFAVVPDMWRYRQSAKRA